MDIKIIPLLFTAALFISCTGNTNSKKNKSENNTSDTGFTRIVGIGKISPANDIIPLSSAVNGIVSSIFLKENDSVNQGSVILELDHAAEDNKISQLTNEIKTQSAQITANASNLREIEGRINNARINYQSLRRLLEKGAETKQNVDNAATSLQSLTENANQLSAIVSRSVSRQNEIKAMLDAAVIERAQKIIRSPVKGILLELTALPGGRISSQESFGQIAPAGSKIAICEIDESTAGNIFIGQKGWIRQVGSADTLTTGVIIFASSFLKKKSLFTDQSGEKEDRRVRTIKLQLDNTESLLFNTRVECVLEIPNPIKN